VKDLRKTELIEMSLIDSDGNIRSEINRETVDIIKKTIEVRLEKGLPPLINPVNVEKKNGRYSLTDGKQRFVAMDELNAKRIEAFVSVNHPMKDWQSHDENRANADLPWYDYARFYINQLEGKMTRKEIANRASVGRKVVERMITALEVCEKVAGDLLRYPYDTIYEISLAPENDWEKLSNRTIENNLSKAKVRSLVNEVTWIQTQYNTIEDEEKREWAKSQIEPLLYTEDMNKGKAWDIILQARGLYISTEEIVHQLTRMVKSMKKFSTSFPGYSEYKEWEDDGLLRFQLTGWIEKEKLEIEDGSN